MTELFIPHSELIGHVTMGDKTVTIPKEGLAYDGSVPDRKLWIIALCNGRFITIEPMSNYEYIYVPNKKDVKLDGFTKLMGTMRGKKGKTEYAVMTGGFRSDGSSPRAAIRVKGQEVLVYPGQPARK